MDNHFSINEYFFIYRTESERTAGFSSDLELCHTLTACHHIRHHSDFLTSNQCFKHKSTKGQSHVYFLRRSGSFNICEKLLQMFYQSVVVSVLFYAAMQCDWTDW